MKKLLGAVVAVAVAGCGVDSQSSISGQATTGITYEQFLSQVYQEDTGEFIANGDEMFEDEVALHTFFRQYIAQDGDQASVNQGLAIYYLNGADVKWTPSQAQNLTYCISTKFGTRYNQVVQAMADATAAWEAAANVNFIHVASADSNCTSRTNSVVFNVESVKGQPYLARAFFPNATRRSRNIKIDSSSFTIQAPPDLTGILRHELGHTLGFRHEHTRPEAGACFEDNNWRALTTYDSSSVMHYPQCNGTGDWTLVLTSRDRAGAAAVYP